MINIDSQLKQRMDQFRGRPQDLMQQYQVSRELIDLLALQKLKSEKDSAARNMMMQMQQNPQTIAAQREAELMGRTQQEVAQQVGGIAQLDDARRKQNLARMASQRPPMRMAEGGTVTQMDAALRRLRDLGGTFGRGIEGLLDRISPARAGFKVGQQVGQRFYDATTLPVEEYAAKYSSAPVDEDAPFEQQPIPGMSTDSLQEIDIASLPSRRPPLPAPTPADLRNAEEARVRRVLGQEGIMSAYQDMIQRQRSLAERLQDPEQQRRDRLSALLRGMAGRSTFGLTGAGGSAGLASERRRQNALAQQLLDKEFGLTKEQLGAQVNIGKEALAGGREAFAQASENARSAANRATEVAIKQAQLAAGIRETNAQLRADILESLENSQDFQLMRAELAEAIDDGDEQAIREAQADLNEIIGNSVRSRFNIIQGAYPRPMSDVDSIERG